MFSKGHHHGWPQEKNFLVQPIECWKRHSEKEIFQSMTLYSTHKSILRNVFSSFVINLVGIWNRNKQTD